MKNLFDWCRETGWEEFLRCYMDGGNPLPPDQVGFSSGKPVRWRCRTCGLSWEASPNKMNHRCRDRTVCPFCSRERPSPFYNAAVLFPELTHFWDRNHNEGSLESYLPKSGYLAQWRCGRGHTWTRSIKEQVVAVERRRQSQSGKSEDLCPYCSHKRLSNQYNLEEVVPEVARQWCYSRNGSLTPRDVPPYSQKKVFWQCAFDESHIWVDRISNRTVLLRGCPICSRHFRISYAARAMYYYLHQAGLPCSCEVPVGRYRIDIEIRPGEPGVPPIALEVDGYRHRLPDALSRDKGKDQFLKEKGYRVVRVKEREGADGEIQVGEDTITYPCADRNRYLDQVIRHTLLLVADIYREPDHVRDHWKIEDFYYHTRKQNSLAVLAQDLAREWSDRNPDRPETVSPGLGSKRWWKCPICGREYQATVYNRVHNHSGCPYCSHLKVTPETSLAQVRPDIAAEWDQEKNAPLTPADVLPGARQKVWWRCARGHSWQAAIISRTGRRGTKCPICQGRTVNGETSLAGRSPELARYWHPSKNDRSPDKVAPCSNRMFWWRCPKGHEWQDMPKTLQGYVPDRVCPVCDQRRPSKEYCLAAQNGALAALWHPTKNTCTPEEITPHSNQKVWWRCGRGHQWQERVSQAARFGAERACPYCDDRKVWQGNCLAHLAPELAAQWNPTKNLPLTPEEVFPWSNKKVWWRCEMGHEWQTTPEKRYRRGDGCPCCSGHRASPENCLATLCPELAREWDMERNTPLTPEGVTPKSGKRVWWRCGICGHSWQSTVAGRRKSKGCPVCHRKQIRHQSLAEEHPELVGEWDTVRNSRGPETYAAHSNQKVWWRCSRGHSWQAAPDERSRGSGCPICAEERRRKKTATPGETAPPTPREEEATAPPG